ncbi:unnamed protein product [Callosobruchus maculatus]|uniref:LysM domain-containing protein n=1 Tax=Callosobruchus maculatus TaxID=64391 RepID=A0A653BYU0_CALMS|nr:unnamed protein product [Callosobruchus maculatus]
MKRSRSSHPPADAAFSPGLRRLAWLNIAVQAAFPLTVAFTPVMAGAGEQHFLQQPAPLSAQRTQVYTLGAGETAASVAKKFHLTLDQLREINQLRTFAHGFEHLKAGDELDVPLAPLPEVRWDGAPRVSASDRQDEDAQAQKVAGYASQAGSFLANNPNGDAAASMARGMATGEAGGALQQWLSHFGTARVQLDADKNFSLKNSQFDLLMPLYDQGQPAPDRQPDPGQPRRRVAPLHPHIHAGREPVRDYDLSRDHARMGAGLEYWRDFLKLGANGYMRLTGWKDSPDLADYQERPANGWDIRAQAWVPSLPQLGGKLTYEQYYGKEVALFGVDNRQKNPHAITAGINYTPVPLVTLGAEQRQGQSGKSDTRLTVDMNYQLGVPWRAQVDPTAVAAMRSLTGSRYDLVERNNNIVLEYRKKETIRLHTADLVTGHAGEQKSLGVSVTSTYGLSRIDWDAAALTAAGGKIVQNGADYAVVLPAYQTTAQAVNTYTVSGVAVDTKGNRSDRADTQVTVQAPEVNKQYSTFTPVSSVLPADGKSTQVLTLTLRDENNQAVDMDVKDISLKNSALKSAAVSALTKKSAGVYTVTVTAGTDVETVTLTPSVSGVTLTPAGVTISSTTPDAGQSVFTASPETIAADNTAVSTLTLVAKDAQGNALTGLKDSLAFTIKDSSGKAPAAGTLTESAIAESSTKGTYTATLRGTTAGKYTIVPEYSGTAMGSLSATVTLTDTLPDEKTSTIKTDTTTYVAGTDITIKVTLKDKAGNALTGDAGLLTDSTVTVPNATLKTGSSWTDKGDGTYTATYTAETASTDNQASLKLAGWVTPPKSEKYAITAAQPDQSQSLIARDKDTYVSGDDITIKVTLKDKAGNALTGDAGLLTDSSVTVPNATLKTGSSWKDKGDGTYTATYTAETASTDNQASLKLAGWVTPPKSEKYAITAAQPDQSQSLIARDKDTYVSGDDITIKVTLKDKAGNALTGDAGLLTDSTVTVPNATLKTGSSWKDKGDGTYTATYTAETASTDNQASLKLAGWDTPPKSEKYAITAAQPDQSQSLIARDKDTYVSGDDITIKVTLKDKAGNALTGDAGLLTDSTVTVPNATLKTGSSWKDKGDGTYTATYTAETASTDNQASLKLAGWVTPPKSEKYAITAAQPDQSQSLIARDKDTYVSGDDITIKVTLKDKAGNALTGDAGLLTDSTVTVPNATLKTGSSWKDKGDGTYTATYTAETASTDNQASLKLAGWDTPPKSEKYAITAAQPDQSQSLIARDKDTYVSGDDITIKVTLKDKAGNALTGDAGLLTDSTVTVPNATLKTGSSWKDKGDGTYTATYTAETASTDNQASLKLAGWDTPPKSEKYAITAAQPDQSQSLIARDKDTYVSGDDITIKVTLKDKAGNALTGDAGLLTDSTVTVPNATLKTGSSWKDKGDGTYTATYTAETASTDNQASLKLAGWVTPPKSEKYAITAAQPDQSQSLIARDKDTYVSGDDITIKVTLKDKAGNALTGDAGLLTDSTVTVPNATLKTGSSWKDKGDGTYTATYTAETASTDNQASLKLAGWVTPPKSEKYAITAAQPDQSQSLIARDKDTYVSGDDITIKVTLKDKAGNALTGDAGLLTDSTVTVQNATLKSGSSWKDNSDGTYTATYTAATTGTGLKAALKLSGWRSAAESETYVINARVPDQTKSVITRDKAEYTSGDDMLITVTLKDAQGKAVTGATASLTTDAVTVQNATLKSGSSWKDNSDGTYTATYTAATTGTGLKAALKLSGWRSAAESETYVINARVPDQTKSVITRDKAEYTSGDDMLITVTLKDAQGKAVTGATASLTTDAVTVQNATLKSGSSWKDNSDGTYTATYTAATTGTGLTAALKLSGWSAPDQSEKYAITSPATLKDVSVNGYTFAKDAKFPTTGFKGATFTLELDGGKPSDFTWKSDASWVSVTDGVVKFTGTGTKDKVTITGTPKGGKGENIEYNFTLSSWYINDGTEEMNWSDAAAYCSAQTGYSQPTVQQLNGNADHAIGTRGTLGGLWSEWGELSKYSGAGFSGNFYWSSEQQSSGLHYIVYLSDGLVLSYYDSHTNYVDAGQRSQSVQHLGCTRASLVVIRGLLTLGWGMTFIAHGAFMRLTTLLDSAEKQITRWQVLTEDRWLYAGLAALLPDMVCRLSGFFARRLLHQVSYAGQVLIAVDSRILFRGGVVSLSRAQAQQAGCPRGLADEEGDRPGVSVGKQWRPNPESAAGYFLAARRLQTDGAVAGVPQG